MGLRAIFRVDADARTGGGHVMRCLTLAGELRRRGWDCAFLVNDEAVATAPALGRSGLPVLIAPQGAEAASRTIREAFPGGADWIIFDHYRLDADYERAFRPATRAIAVIDDLADRRHDCELLLDTTLGRTRGDYAGLVPARSETCFGPSFSLLRPEFAAARAASLTRRDAEAMPRRLFVSLGLTDVGGITARLCEGLAAALADARVDVVLGPRAESLPAARALAARDARFVIHVDPPDIATLMSAADLAVGAGGTTSWERCCLGLPTVLVVLADNQALMARRLEEAGAARVVDHRAVEAATRDVARLLAATAELARMSRAARAICDGAGARDIAARMEAFA